MTMSMIPWIQENYVLSALIVGGCLTSMFLIFRYRKHAVIRSQALQTSLADYFYDQLSEESKNTMRSLKKLYDMVIRLHEFDRQGKSFEKPFLLCFSLLKKAQDSGSIYRWNESRIEVSEVNLNTEEMLRYFASYATNIYKVSILSAASIGLRNPNKVLNDVFSFQQTDIIANGFDDSFRAMFSSTDCNSEIKTPRYFVVYDHTSRSIVLCIRGTFSVEDAVTDLLAHEEPFLNGFAHSGFKQAAVSIEQEIESSMTNALQSYPDYNLVVCGHSMGGSTAILISLNILIGNSKLRDSLHGRLVQCIALGPAPVYRSKEPLDDSVSENIWVLINDSDFVSRFSLATFAQLTFDLRQIDDMTFTSLFGLRVVYSTDNSALTSINETIENSIQDRFPFLSHPGKVYRMHRSNYDNSLVLQKVETRDVDSRMLMFDSMFTDHLPMSYDTLFLR